MGLLLAISVGALTFPLNYNKCCGIFSWGNCSGSAGPCSGFSLEVEVEMGDGGCGLLASHVPETRALGLGALVT